MWGHVDCKSVWGRVDCKSVCGGYVDCRVKVCVGPCRL